MNRNTVSFWFLVLTLAGVGGCSSKPPADESKKASIAPDKIQGTALVLEDAEAIEAALNGGGPSVYLVDGMQRYRLFFKKAVEVVAGKEYVAEGVYAQKAIEEIGDPDQGKNGYPLRASCDRVVNMAWSGMAFDVADGYALALSAKLKRFPARPIFLVTQLQSVPSKEAGAESAVPEVSVAADKQRAFLIEGAGVQTAPLWDPAAGTVRCKVVINPQGKVSELQTGIQLCEAVPWSKFRYQPPVQRGRPVKVKTEVEVHFEPRK
jgi:hypothetical protein